MVSICTSLDTSLMCPGRVRLWRCPGLINMDSPRPFRRRSRNGLRESGTETPCAYLAMQPRRFPNDRTLHHPPPPKMPDLFCVGPKEEKEMSSTATERFWAKVSKDAEGGCWLWMASKSHGYGRFDNKMAHRISYEISNGPIPQGLTIDHLCRKRPCVNPSHLEAVTSAENNRRGTSPSALNILKTHCPQGHPYSGANLKVWNGKKPHRACRRCERAEALARYKKTGPAVRRAYSRAAQILCRRSRRAVALEYGLNYRQSESIPVAVLKYLVSRIEANENGI